MAAKPTCQRQTSSACMHEKAGIDIEKMPSEKCVEVHAGM